MLDFVMWVIGVSMSFGWMESESLVGEGVGGKKESELR